ncbi:hypothetical protein JX265_002824 [Neoarthrinium moseri]|uniref:NIMA interactive protein n=1 Tax=Neoarthrinium moseri TaxID=1658444 RepID=A0A9P9WT48_9PEZI|nr:uncharacterized protein JN550_011411 [Neoarthrinium moseri]KAI1860686.1 hypothetical protein JN550_011411 [Neoarthrinium moseri]KAI1878647.1 hypothetical protein JX265_002824 [Neoarthrinium moseri]
MVEPDNIRTASLYINNQLLSRGLLRDGQSIDFANPEAGAGLQATMGRIMSVVNDLILRRDRDAAQRESLSNTLLSLRADAQRHTTENTRLLEKVAETQRKVDGADATERALRLQLKSTESTVHKLKDEMAKMKTLVAQSRAACANEVRKRDRQIDNLKKAVVDAGRTRGGGKNRDVVTITVVGDTGAEYREEGVAKGGTDDEGYSLRMETNEFLTELAKSLSEENSTLIDLARRTANNLREMSGLEKLLDEGMKPPIASADGLPPPQKSADELVHEMSVIMEHLRTILTNPSFVPIEEVEVRETEIIRLREGWERMEARWKDAVRMMDGWRRRMVSSGKSVDMEELQMGLRLSPVRMKDIDEPMEDQDMHYQELSCVQEEDEDVSQLGPPQSPSPAESLHLVPAPGYEAEEEHEDSDSSIFQDDVDMDDLESEEPNIQILQQSNGSSMATSIMANSMDSPPLPIPPQLSPLKDSYSSGNRRKRRGDFTTIVEERTLEIEAAAAAREAPEPPPHRIKPGSPHLSLKVPEPQEQLRPSSINSSDSTLFGDIYESPIRSNPSRLLFSKPSPAASPTAEKPDPLQARPPRSHPEPVVRPSQAKKPDDASKAVSPTGTAQPTSSRNPPQRTASAPDPATDKPARHEDKAPSKSTSTARNRSPVRPPVNSRLPRRNAPAVEQSPITIATIQAKLAASERDADAARVRAKLKAARMGRKQTPVPSSQPTSVPEEDTDPVKKDMPAAVDPNEDELSRPAEPPQGTPVHLRPVEKRRRERRTSKVVSRRRSTLSPWELESLIHGSVDVPSPVR